MPLSAVAMDPTQRAAVNAEYIAGETGSFGAVTKAEIAAALDYFDSYLADNAATIEASIPAAAKAALTSPQKMRLLGLVATRRYTYGV